MGEFKGTKGVFIYDENDLTVVDENDFSVVDINNIRIDMNYAEKGASHWGEKGFNIECSEEEMDANGILIADALNVRQQINFDLPELLEQRNEMLEMLKECCESLSNVSEVDELNFLKKKIGKLIKEATNHK